MIYCLVGKTYTLHHFYKFPFVSTTHVGIKIQYFVVWQLFFLGAKHSHSHTLNLQKYYHLNIIEIFSLGDPKSSRHSRQGQLPHSSAAPTLCLAAGTDLTANVLPTSHDEMCAQAHETNAALLRIETSSFSVFGIAIWKFDLVR